MLIKFSLNLKYLISESIIFALQRTQYGGLGASKPVFLPSALSYLCEYCCFMHSATCFLGITVKYESMNNKKFATLDLGSNSFLLLISEVDENNNIKVISDTCTVVQLGQGVQATNEFHPDALKRVKDCFSEFQKIINSHNVHKVIAVSTSAARDVKNKEEFLSLGEEFGVPITVIPGEEEARLSYLGASYDQDPLDNYTVLDIGGGSTEFIFEDGKNAQVSESNGQEDKKNQRIHFQSLDVGAVRLKEMFISEYPVKTKEAEELVCYIQDFLKSNLRFQTDKILAVAGTPTTIACIFLGIEFSEEKIHGYEISRNDLEEFILKLERMTLEEIQNIKEMPLLRANVIYVGSTILKEVMNYFDVDKIQVSTKGLRYGVVINEINQ